ncbi:adenine-specific methyltransferase EcoRI family protein [Bifidobacterium sp. W8101]|uniref:adenine-specific methyltransferase EcoRI family protein n=1 Tax=Bifidobacterium TaxID=1678 RepID=UPI0018DE7FAD|nr:MULTISPECIES: adenine-specific methyltransferase EcoRI family protein [Bifidobacterium]MBI0125695.1 adenine-specific methyltransferase EcoRI family protein [Bifidobacterium choladohabitans]MBI0127264.1 adenine-specific methyltransferase EcoRI family protein [Bifidobacterium sp. W8103]MBI0137852.1 adenine-specific methyltransferase EcoRI family protein [Bifidobacterium sp. W8105]MBI0149177.1 adenine-specific methyltransferase EcoRI family protein [Bifidobacterium sp. W8107]
MAGNNSNLGAAKRAKNDEFYTQLTDVEKELRHYRKHFRGATVLCNCDDPFESNFFKFFVLNFNRLGLKKLIATCYEGSAVAEYRDGKAKPYKAVVTTVHDTTGDGGVDMEDVRNLFELGENELAELEGDGDFRSEECLALLDEADIVVTNPPFSLFREYVAVLMEYGKKFIIIGNKNAITYKEIFPLLKDNFVWLGSKSPSEFFTPDGMTKRVNGLTRWFTNLDIKKRHEELILVKKYAGHEDEYPKYDNYDAIEVSKVADIPFDYDGVMGVPITFLDKYCPDQFEIVGFGSGSFGVEVGVKGYRKEYLDKLGGTVPAKGNLYYVIEDSPVTPYKRILIRNKHPEL